jgi:CheY-like chemotaxis protein
MNHIALIEDNADNRLLIEAMIGHIYDIVEYEDGQSGLAGMRASRPALLLLDISLPGIDGIRVLQYMKEDEALRDIPVVAVTAHAMSGDREHYLSLGFDDYVVKPIVDDAVLLEAIARLLNR